MFLTLLLTGYIYILFEIFLAKVSLPCFIIVADTWLILGRESQKGSLPRCLNWLKKPTVNTMKTFLFRCIYPAINYLFKVNNRNTRKRCEICSKLAKKTQNDIIVVILVFFIVNCVHISHLFILFLLLTLNKELFAR